MPKFAPEVLERIRRLIMKQNAMLWKCCLLAVLFTSISCVTVSAQNMFSTNPFNNPLNNMLNTMITGKVNEEMLRQ